MMIKIQEHKGCPRYLIYDNVSNVAYSTAPVPKPNLTGNDVHRDLYWFANPNTDLNLISCVMENRHHNIYFDGEAFICNDEGKTVQRIQAIPDGESPRPIKA